MAQVVGVHMLEIELLESREDEREDGDLLDGQPMEIGEEEALDVLDALGEAMAAAVWRGVCGVCSVYGVGGIQIV
jgi:hypothetical protein